MLAQLFPAQAMILAGLHAQELLLIIPFVQRTRLVESLVTLQPDKLGVQDFGDDFGDLSLARTGGPFNQQRLLECERQKNRRLNPLVGNVFGPPEPVRNLLVRNLHRSNAVDLWRPPPLQKNPRAMLQSIPLIPRRAAHLLRVSRQLDAQPLDVDA